MKLTVVSSTDRTYQATAAQMSPGFRLPAGRRFARLKHDYELYGKSRPTRNGAGPSVEGLPETIKCLYPVFMPLTRAWQFYWADLFALSRCKKLYSELTPIERDVIKTAFKGATAGYRMITNGHGWNNGFADYVNGVNPDKPPMQQETIDCGGNVVELLSNRMREGTKDVYRVATLDGMSAPPNPLEVNHLKTPWLVFKATISRREKILDANGIWTGAYKEDVVNPFPQLGGADVPIPFMGKGSYNYIEASRIEILPEGAAVPGAYHA